jgi:hypothetical protein
LAIVTNTKDSFITVINTKTHKKIKDVNVATHIIFVGAPIVLDPPTKADDLSPVVRLIGLRATETSPECPYHLYFKERFGYCHQH